MSAALARPPILALALLVLVPVPAGAAVGAPAAAVDGMPDSGGLVLSAEQDRELCRDLRPGEVLHWRFEANQPLVFTAHYHRGDEARSLWRKDEIRQGEGDLKATLAARYCLDWFDYQDTALTLRWQVQLQR